MKLIPIRCGRREREKTIIAYAKVDDDFEWLNLYLWHGVPRKDGKIYAENSQGESMARIVLGAKVIGKITDHIDGDTLNNQRNNLRVVTIRQNNTNKSAKKNGKSKYLGVVVRNRRSKYEANITVNGKLIYLGVFINEIDAAKAYDKAAFKYNKQYARLNFPIKTKNKTPLK